MDEGISALVEAAQNLGTTITVVTAGDPQRFTGVDKVISIEAGADTPVEALAGVFGTAVSAQPGEVVLVANHPGARVVAGAVAAKLGAPLLRGFKSLAPDRAEVARFGGMTLQQISLDHPLVLVAGGGGAVSGAAPEIETITADPVPATVVSVEAAQGAHANLVAARKIVAVGRGFKSAEDLQLAYDLADAIGAEVACSRPISEGYGWLGRDRYVGVSGQQLSPDIYIAVGISGQLQHVVGMNESKTVVAINSDEKALIFAEADYAIVGDLYEVLPALNAALA